jgi:hypothetical protein
VLAVSNHLLRVAGSSQSPLFPRLSWPMMPRSASSAQPSCARCKTSACPPRRSHSEQSSCTESFSAPSRVKRYTLRACDAIRSHTVSGRRVFRCLETAGLQRRAFDTRGWGVSQFLTRGRCGARACASSRLWGYAWRRHSKRFACILRRIDRFEGFC